MKEVIKQHNGTVYKYVYCHCGKIHVYEKRIKFGFKDRDIYDWYIIKHLEKMEDETEQPSTTMD